MKVKTWIERRVETDWVNDEKAKRLLHDNDIYRFYTYKEEILDIDIEDIIGEYKTSKLSGAGYIYCNQLYDLVHSKSIFIFEKDDLEYEIIEEGYPEDIPHSPSIFKSAEEFHKWMLEEGKKKER